MVIKNGVSPSNRVIDVAMYTFKSRDAFNAAFFFFKEMFAFGRFTSNVSVV